MFWLCSPDPNDYSVFRVSGNFTRPALTRRPSTSSLDDNIKRTRSNSVESVSKHSKKQYMSVSTE